MKKLVFIFIFFFMVMFTLSAQGFYFDVGISNLGLSFTSIEGHNTPVEFGIGLGLKAGYGPFGNIPIYAVSEFNALFNMQEEGNEIGNIRRYFQPFGGAGILFYPIPILQLGASFGYTLVFYDHNTRPKKSDSSSYDSYATDSMGDFGWNISAVIDLGKNNHGFLLGLHYFGAVYRLSTPVDTSMSTANFGVLVKYAYRKKLLQMPTRTNRSNEIRINNVSIEKAAKQLINDLPENTRLAVINISSNDVNITTHIVTELEFHLVSSRKFTVVDRSTLDSIRAEQNFQMSGEVSDSSAVSIGQILGANIVITGNITGTGNNQRLNLKALDVRTAEIITMVREDY